MKEKIEEELEKIFYDNENYVSSYTGTPMIKSDVVIPKIVELFKSLSSPSEEEEGTKSTHQSNLEQKLKIATDALENIHLWDTDCEDKWDDPGHCAEEALDKIQLTDVFVPVPKVEDGEEMKQFIEACKVERAAFCKKVLEYYPHEISPSDPEKRKQYLDARVNAESILIMYDQLIERLSTSSAVEQEAVKFAEWTNNLNECDYYPVYDTEQREMHHWENREDNTDHKTTLELYQIFKQSNPK